MPTSKFKASPPLLFSFLLNRLVKFSKCLINIEVSKGKFYHGRQYECPGKISVSFCKINGLLNKVNSILVFLPQKQSQERLEWLSVYGWLSHEVRETVWDEQKRLQTVNNMEFFQLLLLCFASTQNFIPVLWWQLWHISWPYLTCCMIPCSVLC